MPIIVKWGNSEHSLIHADFIGRWTWTDYGTALYELAAMIRSVSHTVHIINNVDCANLPTGPVIFPRFNLLWDVVPANIGLLVSVAGKNPPARLIIEMAQRTSRRAALKVRVVNRFEEAIELLVREAGFDPGSLQAGV